VVPDRAVGGYRLLVAGRVHDPARTREVAVSPSIFGVIAPHPPIFIDAVGGGERHKADASLNALGEVAAAVEAYGPETLIVMSPHAPAVYDTFLIDTSDVMEGSLAEFGDDRQLRWQVDTELARELVKAVDLAGIPVAPRDADSRLRPGWLDHASIVPLSFIDPGHSFKLVVLSLSYLSFATQRELGAIIRETAESLDRKVVFVASGDCSHRLTPQAGAGYSPRGKEFDEKLVGIVRSGNLSEFSGIDPELVDAAGQCGLRSFVSLSGFAGDDPVPTRLLSYEGPWGVGYLTALVGEAAVARRPAADGDDGSAFASVTTPESEIVTLARSTLGAHLRGEPPPPPVLTDTSYPRRAGAFVSLHRLGRLRGCIGTISPTKPTLGEEVAHNVLEAAFEDPRFEALSAEEFGDLEMSVDVLHPAEPATIDDLDPKRYGVIVTAGYRRGLLLPDLDGVDDTATQLDIALQKAGIRPDEDFSIQRFRVDRFH